MNANINLNVVKSMVEDSFPTKAIAIKLNASYNEILKIITDNQCLSKIDLIFLQKFADFLK